MYYYVGTHISYLPFCHAFANVCTRKATQLISNLFQWPAYIWHWELGQGSGLLCVTVVFQTVPLAHSDGGKVHWRCRLTSAVSIVDNVDAKGRPLCKLQRTSQWCGNLDWGLQLLLCSLFLTACVPVSTQ